MFSWGVALMLVGAFSFITPLLERQFIIVKALELTGLHPSAAGALLFGLGFFLIKQSQVTTESREISNNKSKKFTLSKKDILTPYQYGRTSVVIAINSSKEGVDSITKSIQAILPPNKQLKESAIRIHLIALITSTYYLIANIKTNTDKEVLTQVTKGIKDGFLAIFGDDTQHASRHNADILFDLFLDYSKSLSQEIGTPQERNNPFDMGQTARLATDNIAGQIGIQDILESNPGFRLPIEVAAATMLKTPLGFPEDTIVFSE